MFARLALVVTVALCIGLVPHQPRLAADPPLPKPEVPKSSPKDPLKLAVVDDWAGKVIYIYSDKAAAAFENTRTRQIGDHIFIGGRVVDDGDKSMANGRMMWIPVDTVSSVIEFQTAKEYLKAAEEWRKAQPVPPAPAIPAIPAS
jgi:hypothetical protein